MPERMKVPADLFRTNQQTIRNCQRVLIESCDIELRLARQFCDLADLQLANLNVNRACQLVEAARKAATVAGRYCRDPETRQLQISALFERISQLSYSIRKQERDTWKLVKKLQ